MTLRLRFLLVLSVFSAVALASGLGTAWALRELDSLHETARRSHHQQLVAVRLETQFLRCTQALSATLADSPEPRRALDRLLAELRPGLAELDTEGFSPAAADAVHGLRQNLQHLRLATERSLFMARVEDPRSLQVFQGWLEGEFAPTLAADTERVVRVLQAELSAEETRARVGVTRLLTGIILGFVTLLLLTIAVLLGLRRGLVAPVESLVAATQDIARGAIPHGLPTARGDEFGRVARSIRDMAEQLAESQRELVQKEQFAALGQMTSSVAHNLRNPLASIRSLTQNLLLEREPEDAASESLRTVMSTVDRMDRWLKGMLTSLRPIPLRLESQDPATVVRDLEPMAQTFARERQVQLELSIADGLPPVQVDRNRLDQALIVLLHNAIEAAPAGTAVTLNAYQDGPADVTIRVRDEGAGMAPEVRERLFKPALSTKENGTGMGLYLAHRIILEHRGSIHVQSEPGQGTAMSVRLPVAATPSES